MNPAIALFFTAVMIHCGTCAILPRTKKFRSGDYFYGLRYIGEGRGRSSQSETPDEQSLYFVSQIKTTWEAAHVACITILGYDASLISLETTAEIAEVQDHLLSSGSEYVDSFWTAGKFEATGREIFSWMWAEEIESSMWALNEPSMGNASAKMALLKDDKKFKAYSKPETEDHYFICELIYGSSSKTVPCYSTNDLVIALDSSGSITAELYPLGKDFASNVAAHWLTWEENRLGFMIYSTDPHTRIPLNHNYPEREVVNKIEGVDYLGGGTRSDLALQEVYRQHDLYNRTNDIPRKLVFLTDGQTNPEEHKPDTVKAAQKLRNANVQCFAIGIGVEGEIDRKELEAIASDKSFVFTTEEFATLKEILKPFSTLACT